MKSAKSKLPGAKTRLAMLREYRRLERGVEKARRHDPDDFSAHRLWCILRGARAALGWALSGKGKPVSSMWPVDGRRR